MDKLEALLIGGYWPEVMEVALGLLTRAGFAVDVISSSTGFRKAAPCGIMCWRRSVNCWLKQQRKK